MTSARRPPIYFSDDEALTPAARPILTDLRARNLDHRWVLAWRSSQAFALNLFAGLSDGALRSVIGTCTGLDPSELADFGIEFEWTDTVDRLAESSSARPHRTQVDVRLDATTHTGQRVVVLVEVKFTELDFGGCSAFDSPDNPATDVCAQHGVFGGEPDRCFQLSNHGHGRRRYDQHLSVYDIVDAKVVGAGCWVRSSLSQPMRNLALANALLADGETDLVAFVVCAPRGHQVIWRRFNEFQHVFVDTDRCSITALPAESVAGLHHDGGADLARRYPDPILTLDRTRPLAQG